MAWGRSVAAGLALLATCAAGCAGGPNHYTIVNRTEQDVALVFSDGPGWWIDVPACGQVVSELDRAASGRPPANLVVVYFPWIPRSPEGGTVDTVVITSDHVLNYGTSTPPPAQCAGPAPSTSIPPTIEPSSSERPSDT